MAVDSAAGADTEAVMAATGSAAVMAAGELGWVGLTTATIIPLTHILPHMGMTPTLMAIRPMDMVMRPRRRDMLTRDMLTRVMALG